MSTDDQVASAEEGVKRREFLFVAAGGFGAVGATAAVWPLIDSLNPAKDVLALATIEVDLSPIEVGQAITVKWQGKPVFIRRRTAEEITESEAVDVASLPDPQADSDRVKDGKAEWLVMVGVCTHLGCIPGGQDQGANKGEYDGWFCPCHGSHYDMSGRIRKGPAPENLAIPEYKFLDDTTIKIG